MDFDLEALFFHMLIIHPLAHLIELIIIISIILPLILLIHHHLIPGLIIMLPDSR
jgi:hypothetical protein